MNQILECESPADIASHAAKLLIAMASATPQERRLRVALSGGSTPGAMYDRLARDESGGMVIRSKVEFYFSDERSVGPESDQSNYRLALTRLFEPLGVDELYVHRMRGEEPDLDAEARRYEELMIADFGSHPDEVPAFDLIFLGLGTDGHTASLFSDFDFESAGRRLIAAPFVRSQDTRRLTFTPLLINAARKVVFMVAGAEKGEALTKVLSSSIKDRNLPASRIVARDVMWLVDRAAAAGLSGSDVNGIISRC